MTGHRTLGEFTVPRLAAGAKAANRSPPRVVAGLPMALVNNEKAALNAADAKFEFYGRLPSYRRMLDKEGVNSPGEVALLGDEATLERALRELKDAGVTDFAALPFEAEPGSRAKTFEYLESLLA